MKPLVFAGALGASLFALTFAIALGGNSHQAQAAPAAATTVQVDLKEYSITASPASVPAGDVEFVASNTGTMAHELVIVKTDLAPDALPVVDNKVNEDAPGVQVVDEIEEFAAGAQESKTVNLEPGNYVLICNIVGHYELGMRTAFTVTGTTAAQTVQVDLKEYSITASPASVPAGDVEFVASNTGTMAHELVIVKTDLAPDALPVVDNKVSEDAPGVQVVDEIEEFAAGTQESKTVNLEPGNYVLICNIVGHYQLGMRTAFTVTGATATATATPATTATPTKTTTPAAPPASGAGSLDHSSGLPTGVWAAIGGGALLALAAIGLVLARRRSVGA